MKQGGWSWNSNPNAKGGIRGRFKCNICGRQYKQEWTKNNHEKTCRDYNKDKKGEGD